MTRTRVHATALLLAGAGAALPPPVAAQESGVPNAPDPTAVAVDSTAPAPSPSALLDSLVPGWLATYHTPGVAVAVVRRDTVLVAGGWGEVVAGSGRGVTADTPFRVASISKLITATAALRLAEEGSLRLDADIASVLGPDDPPRAFPGPVTLHHLLTHTAGFDLSDVGDAAAEPRTILTPRELVRRHPQPQVLPPGLAYHYSNFGFALVGLLVEEASGMPFESYVDSAVFGPLGMTRSTFAQPPGADLRAVLASGHAWRDGAFRPLPLDFSHVGAADALVTTAADMAAFLRFQLGSRTESPVLDRRSLDAMHATHFAASPSPYGMAYAFEENVLAGRRVLQHSGVQLGFASLLVLLPEDDLAVFIAQNARGDAPRWEILGAVLDLLLEERSGPPVRDPGRPDRDLDPALYAGRYRHTGYTHATFEKSASVLGFRGSVSEVGAGPEPGTLRINGQVWRHAPALGPHMFAHAERGWWVMGFKVPAEGPATHHLAGREVLERLRWWQEKRTIQLTLMATTLLALVIALVWARRRPFESEGARRVRRAVRWYAVLWIAALVVFFATMRIVMDRDIQWDYGPSWELWVMLTLLTAAGVGCVVPLAAVVAAWRRRWWGPLARLGLTLFAVAATAGAAALHGMNLIGYRF